MAARLDHGRAQLLTRTGLDWSDKYPSVIATLANVNVKTTYLDGELCGVDEAGLPSFAQTQAATDGERGVRLVYYAFDLLHLDGRDMARMPLIERKALLESLIADTPAFSSTATRPATANSFLGTPASSALRVWSRRRSTRRTHQETVASGAKQNGSTAKSSSSSAGRTRKERGLISGRCCWATTPMTPSLSTPAVWARGCPSKFLPICDAVWTR